MLFSTVAIITIANLILSLIIFIKGYQEPTKRLFAGLVFSLVLWTVSNYLADYSASVNQLSQSTFDTRLTIISAELIAGLFLSFSLAFPRTIKNFRRVAHNYFFTFSVALILASATPLVIKGVRIENGNTIIDTGIVYPLFVIYLLLSISFGLYDLVTKLRITTGKEKRQVEYLLVGAALTSVLAIITNIILPLFVDNFHSSEFGPYFTVFFVAFTTYAITKHGLFNIKVVLVEIATGVLVLLNAGQIFLAKSLTEVLVKLFILALICVFGYLLIKSVREEIDRREEVERLAAERIETLRQLERRNKSMATLQRVADIALNEVDMKTMSQKLLDEIPKQVDSCIGAFLSIMQKDQLTAYTFSANEFSRKIYSFVGNDLEKYHFPVKRDFNLMHQAIVDKRTFDSDKLDDFISPPINKTVAASIQQLIGAKYFYAEPLFAGSEVLGVILYVFRLPKEKLNSEDIDIARAIAGDISLALQRAFAFQRLKDANTYLAELDKSKDEFISMASHELNTPLAAIEGYLSMILDEGMGKVDEKSKTYLSRAYASSKRLAELILDLLNVSRIEQGRLKMKFSKADLAQLAESVIHELQIKADAKKIYLKLEADQSGSLETWCDPDRIREVIVNLVGNAIKFTDKGGITIRVRQGEAHYMHVEVADTGRGISVDDQKKLFQKFSQVKREVDEHQGTGLGLYISKNFVELHKGKVWVESQEGKGATFIFEIPILDQAPRVVEGAILEKPASEPQIVMGNDKEVPKIITESAKKT